MKKLLLAVTLVIPCALSAMEHVQEKTMTLVTVDDGSYGMDEYLLSTSQTLVNLCSNIPPQSNNEPIPLPDTILKEHFDHCFAWLRIIENSADFQSSINAIIQYTLDYDLSSVTLTTLVDVVEFLDIQVPGLLEALIERRDCVKIFLNDAVIVISPEKLKNCSALSNVLDAADDEPITLAINREIFEAILGLQELADGVVISTDLEESLALINYFKATQYPKKHNFYNVISNSSTSVLTTKPQENFIAQNLIETIILADKLGNEKVLNNAISMLSGGVIKKLTYDSCNKIAMELEQALEKIPETLWHRIFQIMFGDKSLKLDELSKEPTLEQIIKYIFYFHILFHERSIPCLSLRSMNKELFVSIISSEIFYEFPHQWQQALIKLFPVQDKKEIQKEFAHRKAAVNNERGLFALCEHTIMQGIQWKYYITHVNYTNLDAMVQKFEQNNQHLKQLPKELQESISNYLFSDVEQYFVKRESVWLPALWRLHAEGMLNEDWTILLCLCALKNSTTLGSDLTVAGKFRKILESETYKKLSQRVKKIFNESPRPLSFDQAHYELNTYSLIYQHPLLADIALGTASGFAGSMLFKTLFSEKMLTNNSLLMQAALNASKIGLHFLCYKAAMQLQNDHLNPYSDDVAHDLVGVSMISHELLRIISAFLGAYAGYKI